MSEISQEPLLLRAGHTIKNWVVGNSEKRRLRGQEVFKGFSSLFSLSSLATLYPLASGGSYVLAAYIREKSCTESELLFASQLLQSGGSDEGLELKSLRQAIASKVTCLEHSSTRQEVLTNLQAKGIKITPLSQVDGAKRIEYFAPYDLIVKRFNVIHEDHHYPHNILTKYPVAVGEVVHLVDAVGNIESDLLKSGSQWFVDLNSWPGAENHNLINDSRLLAINPERNLGIRDSQSSEELTFERAAWLGSPMLSSWGHFVYEGLARLELLSKNESLKGTPILVSNRIPRPFLNLAEAIFPLASFVRIPPGTICRIRCLAIAPLRTFTPHNLHFSLNGELQRLNGEPQLFNALRERVRRISKFHEAPNRPRVFIDREFANYRHTRNAERMRDIARKGNFEIVDPGTLGAMEQLNLFLGAKTVWGQTGSGFFLAPLLDRGAKVLMVGSDFSHDWEGLAHCISDSTGEAVDLITGRRDFVRKGFSEGLYHQDFELSESAWDKIQDWCFSN